MLNIPTSARSSILSVATPNKNRMPCGRRGESSIRWIDWKITTQFALANSVPAIFPCPKKQSPGLFFCEQAFRSSILSEATPNKKDTMRCLFYLVETRRIELLSENSSIGGSPSAVCDRYSLARKFTNNLMRLVASLFMVGSKLCTLTFTTRWRSYPSRGTLGKNGRL